MTKINFLQLPPKPLPAFREPKLPPLFGLLFSSLLLRKLLKLPDVLAPPPPPPPFHFETGVGSKYFSYTIFEQSINKYLPLLLLLDGNLPRPIPNFCVVGCCRKEKAMIHLYSSLQTNLFE